MNGKAFRITNVCQVGKKFQILDEASPGPNDPSYLFDRFVKLMDEAGR